MITGQIWFTGNQCIGIVQIVQEHQKEEYRQAGNFIDFKYYIGVGWGQDEKTDASYIAEHGVPFDAKAGNVLFNVIPGMPV
jgi:hypothetical protein